MPYIKGEDRGKYKKVIESIPVIENAGELNYLITCICQMYLYQHGVKYQTHNDIIGALSNMANEWYRRKIAPYEDKKIKENGDVF